MSLAQQNQDSHHETVQHLVQSLTNADPQRALFYMMALIELQVDPLVVNRLLLKFAIDNIGIGDPYAIQLAQAAYDATAKMGLPECTIPMAEACVYLCICERNDDCQQARIRANTFLMDQHENWYNMRPREPYRRDWYKHQEYDYKYPHDFGGYIVDSAF